MPLEKKKTESGTKARQRNDTEDRSLVYRDFRREVVGKGKRRSTCYTSDLDQIEYIIVKGLVYPVAIIELTRYDFNETERPPSSFAKYKAAIINRYFSRDAQGKFLTKMSDLIGVTAYIVLFRYDLESFYLFDVSDEKANWIHKTKEEYSLWLQGIKEKKTEEINLKLKVEKE